MLIRQIALLIVCVSLAFAGNTEKVTFTSNVPAQVYAKGKLICNTTPCQQKITMNYRKAKGFFNHESIVYEFKAHGYANYRMEDHGVMSKSCETGTALCTGFTLGLCILAQEYVLNSTCNYPSRKIHANLEQLTDPVVVSLKSPRFTSISNYDAKICITGGGKLGDWSLFVNGIRETHRGVSVVKSDGCDYSINMPVKLKWGENNIELQALSGSDPIKESFTVDYGKGGYTLKTYSGKKAALVIGNSEYNTQNRLPNAQNDAEDMADKLRKLGFRVITRYNLRSKEDMDMAVKNFSTEYKSYDIIMVYYAGHAGAYEGKSYLIPTAINAADEQSMPFQNASLDDVILNLNRTNADLKIIVLDACRNNPYDKMYRSGAGRGLVATNVSRTKGMYIAYSTSPGDVAADGTGRNSPFTAALLKKIGASDLSIEELFKEVRSDVARSTGDRQIPWENSSLMGKFYFGGRK